MTILLATEKSFAYHVPLFRPAIEADSDISGSSGHDLGHNEDVRGVLGIDVRLERVVLLRHKVVQLLSLLLKRHSFEPIALFKFARSCLIQASLSLFVINGRQDPRFELHIDIVFFISLRDRLLGSCT